MAEQILLISDLHLSPADPETLMLFEFFLKKLPKSVSALYILGDFFEVWIGDDDDSPWLTKISAQLKAVAEQGVAVYFMQGNRDFLLQKKYCEQSGMHLLPDPYSTILLGHSVILSHGDLLCTQDLDYQRFRRIVRKPWVQKLFLSLPLFVRKKIAYSLRAHSQTQKKSAGLWCDVTPTAVQKLMQTFEGASYLIHGHTHECNKHQELAWVRCVLGDWHQGSGSYIQITQEKVALKLFSKATLFYNE